MALAYLFDEHLRGPLCRAIGRQNAKSSDPIDVVRVGDVDAPPLGTLDADLLAWSEAANRIIVTFDKGTMPKHLSEHLRSGNRVPGIFVIREHQNLKGVFEFLAFAAEASDEFEWQDRIVYIP